MKKLVYYSIIVSLLSIETSVRGVKTTIFDSSDSGQEKLSIPKNVKKLPSQKNTENNNSDDVEKVITQLTELDINEKNEKEITDILENIDFANLETLKKVIKSGVELKSFKEMRSDIRGSSDQNSKLDDIIQNSTEEIKNKIQENNLENSLKKFSTSYSNLKKNK